jgi:hypothetical protein
MEKVGPPNQQQISFVAGANVTLSVSSVGASKTITIIGGGTGATGTGVVASAGTQAASSGTFILSNSNNVSFGMSNSSIITASASYATNSNSFGISNLGNASGTSGVASGSSLFFVLAGGNNITLSQSLNGASGTITISAFTQTVQTQNRFNATISGNTSGALAAISSGTITIAGGNNITISQAGNAITISGADQGGVQTGLSGIIASGSTNTSGTISFANSNGVTFGLSNNTITASVSAGGNNATISGNTSGTSALISSGTMTLAGGNNITLSQVGNAITISGAATSAQSAQTQSNIQAIIPLGNTAGTTGTIQTGSLGLAGGANITISQSSGANSTRLTIIGAAGVPSIAASGNTTGTVTIGAGSLVLAGGNNVTLQGATAAGAMTLSISVPNTASQTVQTQLLAGVRIAQGGAGGATTGTTAFISSGTMSLYAGSNITLSQNGANEITIIAGQSTQTQGLGAFQVGADVGSTSGTTAQITLGTVGLAAGANVTLSQAGGNVVTISVAAPGQQVFGVSDVGNTLGTTGVMSGSSVAVLFVGGTNITLSQSKVGNNVGTITFMGLPSVTHSLWQPPRPGTPFGIQIGQGTLAMYPAQIENYVSVSRAQMPISISLSSSSNSSHAGTLSMYLGFYTKLGLTLSSVSTGSVTYAWTNTSDNSTASLTGVRIISLPINVVATPGDYWIGFLSVTASANANWITVSNVVNNAISVSGSWLTASAAAHQVAPGVGILTVNTSSLPASVALSNLAGTNARALMPPYYWFMNYST